MNQYIVNRSQQIAVEASDPDDAIQRVLNKEGTPAGASYNVQLRPKPVERPTPNA